MESGRYHAAVTTDDVWICYPWEAKYVICYTSTGLAVTNGSSTGILMSTMRWPRRTLSFKAVVQFLMNISSVPMHFGFHSLAYILIIMTKR